jgi:hypothetical protein
MFPVAKAARLPLILLIVLAAFHIGWAQASSIRTGARSDPADPNVVVPSADYQSAFGQYDHRNAGIAIPWKSANDEVARIGGWRSYAKEAAGTPIVDDKPALAPGVPADKDTGKPATGGHSGHQMK